jgi:hypothetical protein
MRFAWEDRLDLTQFKSTNYALLCVSNVGKWTHNGQPWPRELFICFWPQRLGFGPRPVSVEIVMKKWHWQVFAAVLRFKPVSVSPSVSLIFTIIRRTNERKVRKFKWSIAVPKIGCVLGKTNVRILVFIGKLWLANFKVWHPRCVQLIDNLLYSISLNTTTYVLMY